MVSFTFSAIGTSWQIDIYQDISNSLEIQLLENIKKRIDEFDVAYSRFRDDSLVTKISQQTGVFTLPSDAKEMFDLYYDLYNMTDGFFTPFVGQMLVDAGYDANYSLVQKKELETPPLWEQVIEYSQPNLIVKKPVLLDFGAGGKGYLIDLVAGVIEGSGVLEYCIDAGGDMLHRGSAPISVGLENPNNLEEAIGIYTLSSASLCGSAGNRRAWGSFTHIMNPATLVSPTHIAGVWVSADNTLLADCIATCLFFAT